MNHFTIKDREEVKNLLTLALTAGIAMLKNGAETYRVEDTMNRICISRTNIKNVDSFVTQTGIFLTLEYEGEVFTYIRRVKDIGYNINKISLINEFSRKFVSTNISIDEGLRMLEEIDRFKDYSILVKLFGGSLLSGFFSLMFGGSFGDFLASLIASILSLAILEKLSKYKLTFFIDRFVGAFLASVFSYLALKVGIAHSLDNVIIGTIMPLVPGVSITNSIRDTMSGDSLSGLSKGVEAILSALAISFGVGIILNFYTKGLI
ncbi:threonine/serine ThrE exporter family protein [Wansuia hejianensis]|uniref:Threonine/serine exporter family protein n=1 Tax=Wansuia hejianensis TaxID=2763667 RepID=A0A926ILR7_9FIRM|nr:threonine/serine exporter family protein [Wansuia hejianensis]MBC8590429.1 threonine/serine exporter family protein [Wansuia hejianensis]